MLAIACALALLAGPAPAAAAPLDRALDRAAAHANTPGATAALVRDGRLVWSGAAGVRDIDTKEAMAPTDLFAIASATKSVTAAMIMRLVEQGRIGLDDTIDRTLPELRNADRITIRMLLDHSSGLVDYFADGAIGRIIARDPFHSWTRAEVLAHVRRAKFAPGTRHSYSNSNYIALGAVLERFGDGGVEEQFASEIAGPLGLQDSTFTYDDSLLPRLAHPHGGGTRRPFHDLLGEGERIGTDYVSPVWTDGGLVTSAPELAVLANALYSGSLLNPSTVESMLPPRLRGWGLGTFGTRGGGRAWVGHDGLYGGYASESWTDRARGITLVVLANAQGYERGEPAVTKIWRRLAARVDR